MTKVERKDELMTQAEGKHQTLHQHSIAASGDPTAKKTREERLPKQKAISYQVLKGDVLDRLGDLPGESVHCVVTSLPYWGMRDYTWDGIQIVPEATRKEYVDRIVAIFREVRRVLRHDGMCWIKIGNSGSGDSCPGDLDGMPWRVLEALMDSDWTLCDRIILEESNPMPESDTGLIIENQECIYMLAKYETYFYDADAIKGPIPGSLPRQQYGGHVWTIPWEPSKEAHFATVPAKAVKSCILAGTSDKGCCAHCGAPWERVIEKYEIDRTQTLRIGWAWDNRAHDRILPPDLLVMQARTLGWKPTCECLKPQLVPCTVLDPFGGAGTTGVVALDLNRQYIGIQPTPQ